METTPVHDTRSVSFLRRGLAVAGAALLVAVVPVVLPEATAAAPAPLFEEIGSLERFPEDARAILGHDFVPTWEYLKSPNTFLFSIKHSAGGGIVIPEVRQLWQLYFTNTNPSKAAVVIRDLDTFRIVHTMHLPENPRRDTAAGIGGDWAHTVDTVHKRLFLVTMNNASVLEIDLDSFTILTRLLPAASLATPSLFALVTGGITYDRYRDDLLVLYGGPSNQSAANTNTFLYTLDLTGPPDPPDWARTFRHLRSCTGPVTSTDAGDENYNWEVLVTEDQLYIPCQRAGHTGIVVRTARAAPGQPPPPEVSAAGLVYVENARADQAGGRIVMTSTLEKEIWTFEAATMSFVGIAATAPPGEPNTSKTGYGFDHVTGRVFFQSPHFGLGVVEGRYFPLPQARRVDRKAQGQERILVDTPTNRIFVLEGYGTDKARAYRIYRTQPAPVPPPPPDPDRNTADVAEQAGVTEARYNASGSGYGARVVWAKGYATVPPAPVVGVIAPTTGPAQSLPCGMVDREVTAGRVFKAEYDTGSTAAEAVAAEVDGATKQDLDKFSHCDVRAEGLDPRTQADDPATSEQETRWRWGRASCSSSEGRASEGEGKTTKEKNTGTTADFGPSNVACPEPGGVLTASAVARLEGAELSTGRSWTTTKAERAPGGGVRSSAESVAQDVRMSVGGVAVTFAEIRSTATSFANGRPPKEPMSRHRVSIRGVTIDGVESCTTPCEGKDLAETIDTLNTILAGRAQFRTGTTGDSGLDLGLVKGSPRGAQTAVQKSAARQASDRALTGDFTVEVPGLDVITFNDNTHWGRARQLYQFAGVATAATYNIVVRPTGLSVEDLGPFAGVFGDTGDAGATPSFVEPVMFPAAPSTAPFAAAPAAAADRRGGFWMPFRAVAEGLRLLLADPRRGLLVLFAWALFGFPAAISRRRRLLVGVRRR